MCGHAVQAAHWLMRALVSYHLVDVVWPASPGEQRHGMTSLHDSTMINKCLCGEGQSRVIPSQLVLSYAFRFRFRFRATDTAQGLPRVVMDERKILEKGFVRCHAIHSTGDSVANSSLL